MGEGRRNLSEERLSPPFPQTPIPPLSKTFDVIESLLALFPVGMWMTHNRAIFVGLDIAFPYGHTDGVHWCKGYICIRLYFIWL